MDLSFLQDTSTLNLIIYLLLGSGGISGAIHYTIKTLMQRKERKEKRKTLHGVLKIKEINVELQKLRDEYGCSHAFIFTAHDHGKYPSVDNPFYISYTFGAGPQQKNLPNGAIRVREFNEMRTHPGDIDSLIKIIDNKNKNPIIVDVENLQDSVIGDYFKSHGVKNVITHYVDILEKSVYFIVVARVDKPFDESDVSKLNFWIENVRSAFLKNF